MQVKEDGESKRLSVMGRIGVHTLSRKAAHFRLVLYHEKFVNYFSLGQSEDMDNSQPIKFPVRNNASKTMPIQFDHWQLIDWGQANCIVKQLQRRIVKAAKAGQWRKVRALQRMLTHSTSAKALAVRRVTENKGRKTAGIDKVLWDTPKAKAKAITQLISRGYKAQPVRRIKIPKSNGKWRPLGIPTMKDRAMQALYLLALDPVSETRADPNSYGFRPFRSCADAIARCFLVLSDRKISKWILEADIRGCFDNISHEWLLENIPIENRILKQWLKAGYFDKQSFYPTEKGTPQGSVISPTLANMTLDGLEKIIDRTLEINRNQRRTNIHHIHLVRYADDFVVVSSSKDCLENEVKPIVQGFLAKRGLSLSEEKTRLTHISTGFDFLGHNIRKYSDILLIKPSKRNVQTFLKNVQQTIRKYRTATTIQLLYKLNPMIRGWALYHRHNVAYRTFTKVDFRIHWMLWRWARRRHSNKSAKWIVKRYFTIPGKRQDYFHAYDGDQLVWVYKAESVSIQRHVKIRADANPYDETDEMYFEKRADRLMLNKLYGRRKLTKIYKRQEGKCQFCQQKITSQTGWHAHHLFPKHLGGTYTLDNLVLLHPTCHRQVHAQNIQLSLLRLTTKR